MQSTKPAVGLAYLRQSWHAPAGYREVLALAGPLVLSTGSSTVQQFVNRVFLSWHSPESLAAALPAGTLSFTILCFFIGTASYVSTFVAQYLGSGQPSRIAASAWQAIYVSLLSGVLVLPFAALAGPLFRMAGHAQDVQGLETVYFQILIYGGAPCILSSAISAFFTGIGRTRTVMWVNIGAVILNCALDYGLVLGNLGMPRLGIVGAGWATVISQSIGALVFMGLFLLGPTQREFDVWRSWRLDWPLLARLLRFGAPSGLQFMLDIFAWSLFIMLVGRLGTAELGATTLAFQVNSIVFVPMIGFAIATSTLVGQRLGEERPDLATTATWSAFQITFSYMAFVAVLYIIAPYVFLAPFGAKADPTEFAPLRDMAAILMRFVAFYSLFDGVNLIFSAALKGAGDTVFVMLLSSSLSMGLMVLPTWLICRDGSGSIWAAWWSLTVFILVLAVCFLLRFLQGKWRDMRVVETPAAEVVEAEPVAVELVEAEMA